LSTAIQNGTITNDNDILQLTRTLQIADDDAISAVLYNGKYVFSDIAAMRGEILARPNDIPLFATRLLFFLFAACCLACVEAQIYESTLKSFR
jgi:hypothetical protein